MGGGFLGPVVFCGRTHFSYSRQKKPRCKAKRFKPEPKAKGGNALGRMKQEKNKNKCTEICSADDFPGFAMRRDCSVTRDLLTKLFIAEE
jgi:hypothetical protein